MLTTANNRDATFDMAKAIGIIAVVLGHCKTAWIFHEFLYIFHLPLFFIISGYFLKSGEPCKVFFTKKFKTIIIPYICASIIFILFSFFTQLLSYLIDGTSIDFNEILLVAKSLIIQRRYSTLWFLSALFVGETVFWLIDHFIKNKVIKIVLPLILSIGFILYDTYVSKPLPWNIDTGFIVLIFLYFGNILKTQGLFEKLSLTIKRTVLLAIIFFIIAVGIFLFNHFLDLPTLEMYDGTYGIFPLTITSAILMSLSILLFCKLFKSPKVLPFISRNTMVVFALHQSVFLVVAEKFINFIIRNGANPSSLEIVLIDLVVVAVLSIIVGVVAHLLHMDFIFGKKHTTKSKNKA